MNGKQRRAWMVGIKAKTRNDLDRAKYHHGSGQVQRLYPGGSIEENIRACSSLNDVALVLGWIEAAKDAKPSTRRKWIAAVEERTAALAAEGASDA